MSTNWESAPHKRAGSDQMAEIAMLYDYDSYSKAIKKLYKLSSLPITKLTYMQAIALIKYAKQEGSYNTIWETPIGGPR